MGRTLNLMLAVFWLLAAAYLVRRRFGPDQGAMWADPQLNDLAAVLAVLLVVWNVIRWVQRRPGPARGPNPLAAQRRPAEDRSDAGRPAEYHPEFDFTPNQEGTGG